MRSFVDRFLATTRQALRRRPGPKVSLVMPVFNGADFIEAALRSAMAQDYRNLEIIIVDDGSTDETPPILTRLAAGDARVRIIRKDNGGVASALNAGIEAMTGEFFCWLSHDDIHLPHKTTAQVVRHAAVADERVILYSNYDLIDSAGTVTQTVHLDAGMARAVLRGMVNGCTVFVPRRLFTDIGRFDESLPYTQDYDLWIRALRSYRFVLMDEVLVQTRQHPAQRSRRGDYGDEFNALWVKAVDAIDLAQAGQLEGNPYRFYQGAAGFLEAAGAPAAGAHARERAEAWLRTVKVSVVIPSHGDSGLLRAAVHSVLAQTHAAIEILIVHDTPATDPSAVLPAVDSPERTIEVLCQQRNGAGSARNFGAAKASGAYIAFLDSDDVFLPTKIECQLRYMVADDIAVSHTSYFAHGFQGTMASSHRDSGTFKGRVFPRIIASNPIALPTTMVRRDVMARMPFPDAHQCEDFLWWVEIARTHEIGAIDEPLTVVRISPDSVAYHPDKQREALLQVVARLEADERYRGHTAEIAHLKRLAGDLAPAPAPTVAA